MERPKFITDEVYHVYCRGVEKRQIFMKGKDYLRAIHDLFEFNDTHPAQSFYNHVNKSSEVRLQKMESRIKRELMVEILCFCFMPNHYHLLLRQKIEGGITEFMRKFGTGYTNFFNIKYNRVGPLFQGKFKAVHVVRQAHLLYLPHYIHLNPLDLSMPEWREKRIRNIYGALKVLENYRWSSYLDYWGKKNFPSITQRDFFVEIYGSPTSIDYRGEVRRWLESLDFVALEGVMLD